MPRVREEPQERLDERARDPGDREQEPDLQVRERELLAYQRPGGLADTEDQLVQELDREEYRDRRDGDGRASAERAGQAHVPRLPHTPALGLRQDATHERAQGCRDPAARRLILLIGLAYLTTELVLFSLDRPPSWDEAIYLSQVAPGAEPLPFVPSRARGITFLALPVLQLGGSLSHLRLFLAVASAAGPLEE